MKKTFLAVSFPGREGFTEIESALLFFGKAIRGF